MASFGFSPSFAAGRPSEKAEPNDLSEIKVIPAGASFFSPKIPKGEGAARATEIDLNTGCTDKQRHTRGRILLLSWFGCTE